MNQRHCGRRSSLQLAKRYLGHTTIADTVSIRDSLDKMQEDEAPEPCDFVVRGVP